jgi:hypothetical protein
VSELLKDSDRHGRCPSPPPSPLACAIFGGASALGPAPPSMEAPPPPTSWPAPSTLCSRADATDSCSDFAAFWWLPTCHGALVYQPTAMQASTDSHTHVHARFS